MRTFDIEYIDSLSKRLWPYIAQDNAPFVSSRAFIENSRNIALAYGDGVFMLERLEAGTYEVHTLFERGASQYMKEAAHWMFSHTDCIEIVTKVPQCNKAALGLVEKFNFKFQFSGREWIQNGEKWPVNFYTFRLEDWILEEPKLLEIGADFHNQLVRLGVEIDHEDDLIHNRFVGAAMAMIQGGQPRKGVVYYNRWARFYGALPVSLIGTDPVAVDIHSAVLTVRGNELCRLED